MERVRAFTRGLHRSSGARKLRGVPEHQNPRIALSAGADRLRIGYLWEVKEHDAESTPYRDLANSAVAEPAALLQRHTEQFRDALERRVAVSNAFGHPLLRELILRRYAPGTALDAHITNGASGAIWLVCGALLRAGDDVIVEDPVYEPLLAVPEHLGARIVRIPRARASGFALDVQHLLELVTPKTRLIILSNLHNPSAAHIPDAVLRELAAALRDFNPDTRVLVDETFLDHVPGAQPAATLDPAFISISTLSKVYGLSILRCGWVLGAPDVVVAVRRYWVLVENSSSRLTDAIATVVLENLDAYREQAQEIVRRNRALVRAVLSPLIASGQIVADIPDHGSILFAEVPGLDARTFAEELRTKHRLLVAAGHHFGEPSSLRIGFGRETDGLTEDLRTLIGALAAHER